MKHIRTGIAIILVLLTLSAWAAVFAAAQNASASADMYAVQENVDPNNETEPTSKQTDDDTSTSVNTEGNDSQEPTSGNSDDPQDPTSENSDDPQEPTSENPDDPQEPTSENPDDPQEPTTMPEEPVAEPTVSITASCIEVEILKMIQLTAETSGFSGTPTLTWSSSDKSLATVDQNGKVKGRKAGRVTITVTATDGAVSAQDSMDIYVISLQSSLMLLLQKIQILGYKYHYQDDYYYVNDPQCWQRGFGFARFYDLIAPYILLEYDYVRVFFTYQNKDYMIQLWKGQYGLVFHGCEQGIYYKDHSDRQDGVFTFYKTMNPNEWPQMEMTLYHDQNGDGNYEREFTREKDTHWWCSGFKFGHLRKEEPASELRQEGTIYFQQEEMAKLFADGLKICGFGEAADQASMRLDEYSLNGSTVSFRWQNINDAETTMPIKLVGGSAIAASTLALVIGIIILLLIGLFGSGILLAIIIL